MIFEFRHSDDEAIWDSQYDAEILRYTALIDIPWGDLAFETGRRFRLIVQTTAGTLPLDMLYLPRGGSNLLVGMHGALDANGTVYPRFQFEKSFSDQRHESLLFLFDSTLLFDKTLRVGWMAGDPTMDLAEHYGQAICDLSISADIDRVALVGHSAGGLAAVRIASFVPNSHAIVVNGQAILGIHTPWIKKAFQKRVMTDCSTVEQMLQKYESRFDVRSALKSRAKGMVVTWFQHVDDHTVGKDYNVHFRAMLDHFNLGQFGGSTSNNDFFCYGRWTTPESNKHALPGTIIPFIEVVVDGIKPETLQFIES